VSPGTDQITVKAGGEILCSEINKLTSSVWNKDKLPQHGQEAVVTVFIRVLKVNVVISRVKPCY
jgi:hypothetical protein